MGARVELEVSSVCPNNKAQGIFTPTLQVHEIAYHRRHLMPIK
jgi:hypothetical protein